MAWYWIAAMWACSGAATYWIYKRTALRVLPDTWTKNDRDLGLEVSALGPIGLLAALIICPWYWFH